MSSGIRFWLLVLPRRIVATIARVETGAFLRPYGPGSVTVTTVTKALKMTWIVQNLTAVSKNAPRTTLEAFSRIFSLGAICKAREPFAHCRKAPDHLYATRL